MIEQAGDVHSRADKRARRRCERLENQAAPVFLAGPIRQKAEHGMCTLYTNSQTGS
jgi:hypothetical protein